jgi:hypothetical protein
MNNIAYIDSRPKLVCSCGCGKSASLPYLKIVKDGEHTFYVLPDHEKALREKRAALRVIVAIIKASRGKAFWRRWAKARELYRAQSLTTPHPWRATALFCLPQRLGLWLSSGWR